MRRLLGCLVLIAGVAGLGSVAMTGAAPRIQSTIATDAAAVASSARHSLQSQVSGRDIVVTGQVNDPVELAELEVAFQGINGARLVDVSGVQTLPAASPFALVATRDVDGTTTLAGVIPSEADRTRLAEVAGDRVAQLTLAADAPDTEWTGVAAQGLAALERMQSGDMTLSDQILTLRGRALNPDAFDAMLAQLNPLPEGYEAITEVAVEDDGTPIRLSLSLENGMISGAGKFPMGLTMDVLTDRFEDVAGVTLQQSNLPAFDPQWADATRAGLDALDLLIDGTFSIEATSVSLMGSGSPEGVAQAQAALGAIPDSYTVTTELRLWDDGVPAEMTMHWDGVTATASGKFPADFAPRGPAGVAVTNTGTNSFLPDEGAFTTNATAGTTALGLMSTGTLTVTDATITLTGTAASPQVGLAMDSVLANAAPNTGITRNLTYLDDGSPAAWTLTYDATTGAAIEGRLPIGLAIGDLDLALGVGSIAGTPATALEDDSVGTSVDTLKIVADYLPEIETLTYARDADQSALDLVMSPGVDIDLVANDLAERLPTDVAFSLAPLEDLPADGTPRTNTATGLDEVFSGGFWLPSLDFDPDVAGCAAQTLNVLDRGQIEFLSSSARLNATSIRSINALAAVALRCTSADLTFEVGGHTDATGSELDNVALSQDRADAVRAALIARGVPAPAATAYGFGQSQPVQDNATPEGRAANRRTDITWFAEGALRDP